MEWTDQIAAYLYPSGAAPSGVSGDLLQALGDSCQSAIERAIGRTFEQAPYYELYDGDGRPILYLSHDPIQSLVSVTIDGCPMTVQTAIPSAPPTFPLPQSIVKQNRSAIVLTDGSVFSAGFQNVGVSYTAGIANVGGDIPGDLKLAVVYWAAQLFKDRDKLGISSITAGQQVTTFTHNIPTDIGQLINGWRRAFLP
jgi:hypothetical protein